MEPNNIDIDICKLDAFTTAYLECALWSSTDDDGSPLDDEYDLCDIATASLKEMVHDCEVFQAHNADLLSQAGDDEQNGHDFWLTRNHHGAGFWDRGYLRNVGNLLTTESHSYGSSDLY